MRILARTRAPQCAEIATIPSESTTPQNAPAGRSSCDAQAVRGDGPAGASGGLLGTYAKTSSAGARKAEVRWFPVEGSDDEVMAVERRGDEYVEHKTLAQIRCERYRLKGAVNRLLVGSRTSKCCRWRVPGQTIQVLHSAEHGKAFYSGLQVCASVWLCPVCAPKISERRREELKRAMDKAESLGLSVMLMTLTVPHGLGDDLDDMLDSMMKAYADTSTTRAGRLARKTVGLRGTVRVLEVTHGRSGWHPHFHVLLFLDAGATPDQVKSELGPIWQHACEKRGLPRPSDAHGVDVRSGHDAAAYVSKWGLEHEMTKGHLKASKSAKGATPWGLLSEYLETRTKRAAALWLAYAAAFKGRRQLCWSKGLRQLLEVEEMDDAEIAAIEDSAAVVLAELTEDQWADVLTTRSEAHVLQVAEENPGDLGAFLAGLSSMAKAMRTPGGSPERPPGAPSD